MRSSSGRERRSQAQQARAEVLAERARPAPLAWVLAERARRVLLVWVLARPEPLERAVPLALAQRAQARQVLGPPLAQPK